MKSRLIDFLQRAVQFTVYDSEGATNHKPYYNIAPGLAVEISITVDRLKVLYPKTRIAPVLFLFSNQSLNDDDDFVIRSTWSDGPSGKRQSSYLVLNERTRAGVVGTDHPPAYIHFSPVSRVCPIPDDEKSCLRSASIGPRQAIVHKGSAHKYSRSLVYAYYGDRFDQVHETSHKGRVGAREQYINLGDPGDGAYAATNYSSWSMVLSFGSPPTQSADSGNRTAWIAATSVIMLVSTSTAFGVWRYRLRRRRQRADHSVIRIEPAARRALEFPDARATESGPVEPFLLRKMLFPFRRRRSNDSSDKPLLVAPPPAYNSIFDEESQRTSPL
ncbi:unnamed protein product [Dicrocoelium dendriticum]|nr:unnamed protein product [Dicrocoelium dendriticum]